jgi:hypothetical protein
LLKYLDAGSRRFQPHNTLRAKCSKILHFAPIE